MKMEQGGEPTICLKNRSLLSLIRVGLTVAKTTKIGHLPVKFLFGIEKSVVRRMTSVRTGRSSSTSYP